MVFAGGYMYMTMPEPKPASETSMKVTDDKVMQDETSSDSFVGNFMDLISSGKTVMCTWQSDSEDSKMTGTTYVDGDRMSAEYIVTADNQTMVSNMVGDGTMMYFWTTVEGQVMGYKMDYSKFEETVKPELDTEMPASPTKVDSPVDQVMGDYTYDCSPWTVDASVFALPTDVTFMDMNLMLQNVNQDMSKYLEQMQQ